MLDLLPLVLEEGQPAQSSTDAQEASSQESGTVSFIQPLQAREQVVSPPTSRPSSKGIMAKYKSYINGRRKSGSDTLDEPQNGRRSVGAEELDNFAPLAHGENGAGSGQYHGDRAAHEQTSPSCPTSPPKEPSKFMDKVRAYKKKSRSTSKSGDLADAPGPLANGINQDAGLQEFFAGVSEAKALLAEVIERQRQITAARERSRTLVKPLEVQAAREQVQDEVEAVTVICKRVKAKLDELDTINAQLLDDDQEDVPETAALQMRLSVMAGLNAKLAEVTKSWQEMRVQWHEEDREEVALQLHTVTGRDYAPEEVEQLVQSGGAETIYRQALSTISGASVQQAMSDVQARHDQMAQLEASMLELHQVFLDMSILVADQGDTINNIDNWVCSTRSTMQESVRQLRAAKRDRRRAAQTKAITFVTGVGLIAGGAGLTATGVGAVAGVPMIIAGAAAVGGSAIGGIT